MVAVSLQIVVACWQTVGLEWPIFKSGNLEQNKILSRCVGLATLWMLSCLYCSLLVSSHGVRYVQRGCYGLL